MLSGSPTNSCIVAICGLKKLAKMGESEIFYKNEGLAKTGGFSKKEEMTDMFTVFGTKLM